MRGWLRIIAVVVVTAAGAFVAFPELRFWEPGRRGETLAKSDGETAARKGGRAAGRPAPVAAAVATAIDMPVILTAPGTVEPMATVAIKPRVDGQIVEVGFNEGDLVKAGQVLFRLDERLVTAQMRQAEANIARDRATLKDAEGTLVRREQLVTKQIVTEAATETARAQVAALKASIAAGEAQLEMQRTQLDYLMIRAPISGRTGSLSAKLGANVRAADGTALVTINQTQPIAVGFALPQGDLAALRGALTSGAAAEVTVAGASPARLSGKLHFIDNQVDRQTGTITAKVTVANDDEMLWPGQAVEVALTVEVKPKVVSVPAAAVLPAQQGMLVWVIGADDKVAPRPVVLERIVDQTAFLAGGLEAGERVVTDGQLRLSAGAPVTVQGPRERTPVARERPNGGRS